LPGLGAESATELARTQGRRAGLRKACNLNKPLTIDVIASQTGFADRDRIRRAFLRAFGQPPEVIRRNARAEAAA
jgi:transcriptional regulator GlxA family with amidase domain